MRIETRVCVRKRGHTSPVFVLQGSRDHAANKNDVDSINVGNNFVVKIHCRHILVLYFRVYQE